jgi:two-component system nitrate/nitrite response regulator NarL
MVYDDVVVSGKPPANVFATHLLLVDATTLRQDLLAQYPGAKVMLIDTGIETEKLRAALLSYRMHGVLSSHAGLNLLKKAPTAMTKGQIWIDNGSVKALLQDTRAIFKPGKIKGTTAREKEIIECIHRGLSNKEIAQRLALSGSTMKTHLNNVFRKFNVTSREKLMALTM